MVKYCALTPPHTPTFAVISGLRPPLPYRRSSRRPALPYPACLPQPSSPSSPPGDIPSVSYMRQETQLNIASIRQIPDQPQQYLLSQRRQKGKGGEEVSRMPPDDPPRFASDPNFTGFSHQHRIWPVGKMEGRIGRVGVRLYSTWLSHDLRSSQADQPCRRQHDITCWVHVQPYDVDMCLHTGRHSFLLCSRI